MTYKIQNVQKVDNSTISYDKVLVQEVTPLTYDTTALVRDRDDLISQKKQFDSDMDYKISQLNDLIAQATSLGVVFQ